MIKVSVANIDKLQQRLRAVNKTMQDKTSEGVFAFAGQVMQEAQKTVPVRTGRLRASAFIERMKRNQHRTDATFGYRAPYARLVHENPASSGYKWFERAYFRIRNQIQALILKRVVDSVRRVWGSR